MESCESSSQRREGAGFPSVLCNGVDGIRCRQQGSWHLLPSIVRCRDRSLEADSMGFAQSHPVSGSLLTSDPGFPPASPGCPSPGRRGKEKGKNCVWGQVMQQGHPALSDLTFSAEDTLSTFARLRSCLLFRTYFGNYPPSLMPQRWELPAGAEATFDPQPGFCLCKFQAAFNRNYRHLSWWEYFFFSIRD